MKSVGAYEADKKGVVALVTLVLTFMSRDYALMVGDTRICVLDQSGRYSPFSDDAVKIEHVNGLLVCFAGVARFARIPTIEWLHKRFAKSVSDLDTALEELAKELDGRVERSQYRGHTLTVTIAGWAVDDVDTLTPIVATVTNQEPRTFERLASFRHAWRILPTAGGWVATGQLDPSRDKQLHQDLSSILQEPVTPDVLANIFLAYLRDEAEHNVTVGRRAKIATLPRSVLINAQEQEKEDFIVWKVREPVIVAEVPMEIDVAPSDLQIQLYGLDQLDLSQAEIVD